MHRHAGPARLVCRGSPARFRRSDRLAQFAAADGGGPAREGRPRRLLDVHLHQLAPNPRLRPRLGREVRGPGVGRGRRPHARVPVRARRRQRPPSREGHERRVPDRTRQRLRGLAGVRQPLLAGRLHRRRARDGSGITNSARAVRRSARGSSSSCCARPEASGIADDLVSVAAEGFEAQADWANLESPETYLGYEQGQSFASPGGAALDEPRTYARRTG